MSRVDSSEEGDEASGAEKLTSSAAVAELLELLADAREEAGAASSSLVEAVAEAERSNARANTLNDELGQMSDALVELDRLLDTAIVQLDSARQCLVLQGDQVAGLTAELTRVRGSEASLREELETMHRSKAWKAVRSLQRASGRIGSATNDRG